MEYRGHTIWQRVAWSMGKERVGRARAGCTRLSEGGAVGCGATGAWTMLSRRGHVAMRAWTTPHYQGGSGLLIHVKGKGARAPNKEVGETGKQTGARELVGHNLNTRCHIRIRPRCSSEHDLGAQQDTAWLHSGTPKHGCVAGHLWFWNWDTYEKWRLEHLWGET